MALPSAVTSTMSTILNNISIMVTSDYNTTGSNVSSSSSSSSGGGMPHSSSSIYTNFSGDGVTTVSEIVQQDTIPNYESQAVTYGVSQPKIIAVMILLIAFSIFGCLGNGLVIYVFSKKSDKVTSTIFILALAWTDFFTCLFFIPLTVVNIHLHQHLHLDFFCKLYQFLSTCSVPLSAFIMVAIAVDRYFSICHPFVNVVTPRRARIALFFLVLLAFTFGSITACFYTAHRSDTQANHSSTGPRSLSINDTLNVNLLNDVKQMTTYLFETPGSLLTTEPSQLVTDTNVNVVNDSTVLRRFHTSTTDATSVAVNTEKVNTEKVNTEKVNTENINTDGLCVFTYVIFSEVFAHVYQKLYLSFFAVSLLAVFTLYFCIYRTVSKRRAWRRKQKSWTHSPLAVTGAESIVDNGNKNNDIYAGDMEHLELATQNNSADASRSDSKESYGGNLSENVLGVMETTDSRSTTTTSIFHGNCPHENGLDVSTLCSSVDKKANRERRDFNFLANIRTAIMLFVVTLVFVLSFLPAWLMATQLINFEIIIFYMHCIYNVANPVIYAFMNQSFRKELKRVFQRGTHLFEAG